MSSEAILLRNIHLSLNQSTIFKDFSLNFKPSGMSLLIGANGSGKTQLLRLIHGLNQAQSGEVVAPDLAQQALLYQTPILLGRSGQANLDFLKNSPLFNKVIFEQLPDLIEQFELTELLNQQVFHLSVGQQKRLAMVRLLLQAAACYLLDEPTANVDFHTTTLLESAIEQLLLQNKKVIVTTHDFLQMQRLFQPSRDEIILLSGGKLIEQSDSLEIDRLKAYL